MVLDDPSGGGEGMWNRSVFAIALVSVLAAPVPSLAAPACSADVTLSKQVDGPFWFHSDIVHGEVWGSCPTAVQTYATVEIAGPGAAAGAGTRDGTIGHAVAEALCWVGVYVGDGKVFTAGASTPGTDQATITIPEGTCKLLDPL